MRSAHWRILASVFMLDCALMIVVTAAPFYIYDQLGGTERTSGTIGALQSLGYATVCLLSTRYVERAKNGLLLAMTGCGISGTLFLAALLFKHPVYYACCVVPASAALGLFWPAIQSWLGAESDPKNRHRLITLFNLSWSSGFVAGPLLGGRLYDYMYFLPYFAAFALSAVTFILVASTPHERAVFVRREEQGAVEARVNPGDEARLPSAWVANAFAFMLLGASTSVYPKRIDELAGAVGLDYIPAWAAAVLAGLPAATLFSLLAFSSSLARTTAFALMSKAHGLVHKFWPIALAQAAAGAGCYMLANTDNFGVMALCYLIIGLNTGICFVGSVHFSLANPAHKHRRAAIHESTVGTGLFVGSLTAGILARAFGLTWPFRYAPVLVLAGLAIELALLHRRAASS